MKNISLAKSAKYRIKIHSYLIILLLVVGCSKSDDKVEEESSNCLNKNFLESFLIEPGDCVVFRDYPEMTFTILEFEPYTKTHPNDIPHARISARLEDENASFEFSTGMVYEDIELDGTSFSGRVETGFKNIRYTIFFDNIEFTETETQFIFHKASIRFGYYDLESD